MDEVCITVNEQGRAVGTATKRDCHRWRAIQEAGLTHRAFSLFLFRAAPGGGQVQLLLQKRSGKKITFPRLWTNTCCSHPLASVEGEQEMGRNYRGIRQAAVRKALHELGATVMVEDLHVVAVFRYRAQCQSSPEWGESEVDYVVIANPLQEPAISANDNEVEAVCWAGLEEAQLVSGCTPWFEMLRKEGLLGSLYEQAASRVFRDLPPDACDIPEL